MVGLAKRSSLRSTTTCKAGAASSRPSGTLYHVPYRPLCFGHTEIHRHDLQFIHLASGILLQQHVAHLRTVTVAYDQIVVHGNKLQQGVAGILYVL
mgnify:CR=1 FL=1